MSVLLAIGTGKGLFLARSEDDRKSWEIDGPHAPMREVYGLGIDHRSGTPRVLAGVTSSHFGPSVSISDDLGGSWREAEEAPVAFPKDTGASLERVWQFAVGVEPDVVYAGTEPQGLFKSTDGGATYEMVRGLWEHPHREQWGAGFGGPAVHTILPHPTNADEVLVAMSTGGAYRTQDGGRTWHASNTGIRAYFFPENEYPEFGQCVHKIARDSANPDRLYLQNHHGVYRSDDGGATWQSIADGLPSDFGFPIVAHPHRGDVVYNFPLTADSRRIAPDARCRVYRSQDAGNTWEALSDGLPETPFYPSVLRDAMCTDNAETAGVYFGTRSGELYGSRDEGDSWQLIAAHLPEVLSVRAVEF